MISTRRRCLMIEPSDGPFVARLRALRCARVARESGVRLSTIYDWLAGRKAIQRATYQRLVAAMSRLELPPATIRLDIVRDRDLIERIRRCGVGRVAARAGLHPMTITNWIQGRHPVRPQTREAIMAAAEAVGPKRLSETANARYLRQRYKRGIHYSQRKARREQAA